MQRRSWLAISCLLSAVACGDDAATGPGGNTGGSGGSTNAGGTSQSGGSASTSNGGAGGQGGSVVVGSEGCGLPLADATETWVPKSIDVAGTTRDFFVYLPAGYDPTRAYPVVYQFHGCSGGERQNNNVPVEDESGADAIHVRGRAVDDCWDTSPNGPDVAFFDALVGAIESGYCADKKRRFATGYSSGSFMTHVLACVRGDALRGVATIAGGQAGSNCSGKVAALLIHDSNDNTVNLSASVGARDSHLDRNGCAETTTPFDPSPCVTYDGCEAGLPVVWCQTQGMDHSRQDDLAAPAFWKFLSAL